MDATNEYTVRTRYGWGWTVDFGDKRNVVPPCESLAIAQRICDRLNAGESIDDATHEDGQYHYRADSGRIVKA